ncbi:3-mercaptopyruvate sulfurtransferase [Acuticoccus sp. MNP-M23]|uniref:3-mercaptopyruvate sulfurtransferase n=1 Tax=Acuticoccus sp. MNP-M23 TaxID=3072793 RepID=UPI0028166A3A|nr:3-mercaptopyruvate sulfurtransferase [Acuticoccus sp. MNP-M23]WMS43254.1 3-mercaptopyruvate sulfurtransferase [Acuticoccus sp. MNP-M23]
MSLVDPAWLAARLGRVVVLDASWHMPDTGRDPAAEFTDGHIPGARRFDIDTIADTESPLPHTLPSPERFAAAVGALGIDNGTEVVVYEAGPVFSAPRAWWMFRVMGHDAKILDGGFARWRAEGFPVETGAAAPAGPASFTARFDPNLYADADTVARTLDKGGNVLDARGAPRFEGAVPEPRPGLRAGHMPGARNLPYASLVAEDGTLKKGDALKTAIDAAEIDPQRPVITSCGSGVTAAILSLALSEIGVPSRVYDGSWTEWGGDPARPVATGTSSKT